MPLKGLNSFLSVSAFHTARTYKISAASMHILQVNTQKREKLVTNLQNQVNQFALLSLLSSLQESP